VINKNIVKKAVDTHMKTPIIYKYGPTNLAKTEPALMEWSEDGKLRIWTEDVSAGTKNAIAELSPQEITKVSGQMTSVTKKPMCLHGSIASLNKGLKLRT
jgi:hypothetical protein